MKLVRLIAVVTAILVAALFTFDQRESSAQAPPSLSLIIYQGNVTIAGEQAPEGLPIIARIGDEFESSSVTIENGRYVGLTVGPGEFRLRLRAYQAGRGAGFDFGRYRSLGLFRRTESARAGISG